MSGYYKLQRGILEHPAFRDEPFTEREAWIWLIENASYVPSKLRHKNTMISLGRGQIPTSYRKLQSTWKWGVHRVRNFLALIENEGMITRKIETGFLIISVCNYDKYQHTDNASGNANSNTNDNADETLTATNISKGEVREKKYVADDTRIRLFENIQSIINSPIPIDLSRVNIWIENGATPELIINTITRLMAKRGNSPPPKSIKYFEQAVADAIADTTRPMEQGHAGNQGTNQHGTGKQPTKSERARAALARGLEEILAEPIH